jgi:hypothetical protein
MKLTNRKAKFDREIGLSALESFANLGDTPDRWKRFRLKWPEFFPTHLTEWLYRFAESWANESRDFKEILKPPLIFYRDCVRRVWSGEDRKALFLKFLLGFERDVRRDIEFPSTSLYMPGRMCEVPGRRKLKSGSFIPGQPADEDKQTTMAGLPPGKPIVSGTTGAITWEFGCALQQSVYELMQQRWRAMVCPECRKFFLADKTRQVYCSSACFGDMKRKRSLEYWNRKGNAERDRRRVAHSEGGAPER